MQILPWWAEAIQRGLLGSKSKCETCMNGPSQLSEEQRQLAGCGFLPPPRVELRKFVEAWGGLGYSGDKQTVCPGYTTNLPETVEIARARIHWSKGSLADFCGGKPTGAMLMGLEIIEGAVNECQSWSMENRAKGGK